ncbi:MAG: hypothetical protein QOE70_5580 [Chthoniobacter sp.]|jgi:uncharacterized protein (DUF58 family)|nr:hypothetical protein [Chthoniobacter sp.]
MAHVSDFLTPTDLQKISSLQIVARQVVEGFCSGMHRSPHKGFSVEFKQHRQYVAGDEIRHIDWRVYGRSDRYYIREYEEETNLRATILLDLSGSMNYGRGGVTKYQYATRLAASLAYLMIGQQDSVGMVTFDTKIRKYIPPRSRVSHLRVLIDELQRGEPGGETELGDVFHDLVPKLHRRGLLIILSDCFGDVPSLLKALAHFRHAHHEILIFQIWDRDELEFPFHQWTQFECLERTGVKHLLDPVLLREAYLANLEKFRTELVKGCRRHKIDLVPFTTDQPYADALAEYVSRRRARG